MKYYDKMLWDMADIKYQLDYSGKMQFRKRLKNELAFFGELDDGIKQQLSRERTVSEIKQTLSEYSDRVIELTERRDREFYEIAEELKLPESFVDEFFDVSGLLVGIKQKDGDVYVDVSVTGAVREYLVLKNAECKPRWACVRWIELSRTDVGYQLGIVDDESGDIISIEFTDAEKIAIPSNAANLHLMALGAPMPGAWRYLEHIADGISEHIERGVANKKETELSDLIDYLNDEEQPVCPQFTEIAKRHGAEAVVSRYSKSRKKMFKKLSESEFEPIWREIYNALCESQEEIPDSDGTASDSDLLGEHCGFIASEFKKYGFEGGYPSFYKYDADKNRRYYIFCKSRFMQDSESGDYISAEIIYGSIAGKKAEGQTDIFSCMFGGGKDTSCKYLCDLMWKHESSDVKAVTAVAVSAAAKDVQGFKLTAEEKKNVKAFSGIPSASGFLMVLTGCLIISVLFGLLMVAGFMLIEFLFVLIFTRSFKEVAETFTETPWWKYGVGTSVGAAVAFGLLAVCQFVKDKIKS